MRRMVSAAIGSRLVKLIIGKFRLVKREVAKMAKVAWIITAVMVGLSVGLAAQSPQAWKLWEGPKVFSVEGPQLYKVQDGSCSVYVLVADNGHGENVAVATGQGCH